MNRRFPAAPQFLPFDLLAALNRHGVRYVVIGGVAAVLHGSDQLTSDLDLAHERTPENIDRLVAALTELRAVRVTDPDDPVAPSPDGFQNRIERFVCPIGNVDVFAEVRRVGGYERLIGPSEHYEIRPGLEVRVADIDTLILSKAGSGRDKDPSHIRALQRVKEERVMRRND